MMVRGRLSGEDKVSGVGSRVSAGAETEAVSSSVSAAKDISYWLLVIGALCFVLGSLCLVRCAWFVVLGA